MKSYVERHNFIDKCRNYYRNNGWMKDEVHLSLENVEVLLAYTPAPDVREVKHGHWVKVPGFVTPGGDPVWGCSECGKGVHVYGIEANTYAADVADQQWIACPNCGAVMDEVVE